MKPSIHEIDVLANCFTSRNFRKRYEIQATEFKNKRYRELFEALEEMKFTSPEANDWIKEAGRITSHNIDDLLSADTFSGAYHLAEMRRENLQEGLKELAIKADSMTAEELDEELKGLKNAPKYAHTATTVDLKQYVSSDYEKYLTGRKNKEFGFFSSWPVFDKVVGPERGHLITLAARPSVGKSAFAMNLAYDYAQTGQKILYVSLEMSLAQLTNRLAAQISKISNTVYKYGDANEISLGIVKREIAGMVGNIQIMEGGLTMDSILEKARQVEHDILVIDHIDLLISDKSKSENEATAIARMTSALKSHARERNCLVICLSQFNRESKGEVPQLHQLRGSGAKEQDSDIVLILHRSLDEREESFKMPKLIVAKNRDGQVGEIAFSFIPEYTTFNELKA